MGFWLVASAGALMTSGYVLRLAGASSEQAGVLSMDGSFSVPRLFVASLFAAAALAAVAGAGSIPGRRIWWLAVGLAATGIAAVKAAGDVHFRAVAAMASHVGEAAAVALSALVALCVVGTLSFLGRTERRDRRRVLGALSGYALASVGLSALSNMVSPSFQAAATVIEEAGEALAGVAFLVAVLIGVAPRMVLPTAWALRRDADAHTLDVLEALPGRTSPGSTTRS